MYDPIKAKKKAEKLRKLEEEEKKKELKKLEIDDKIDKIIEKPALKQVKEPGKIVLSADKILKSKTAAGY